MIWNEDKKKDKDDTDRSLFSRFVEGTIIFLVCCYAIRLGMSYLLQVKVPLLFIALAVGIITILWRVIKWRHRDDY